MTVRIRLLTLLCLTLLVAAGCSSTPETPLVAGTGALEPERASPAIGSGDEVPQQALLDPNRVVARVNDQTLTVRSIDAQFPAVLRTFEGSDAQLRSALDQLTLRLIADRLFLEAAARLGIQITKEDLAKVREQFEKEAIARGTTMEADLAARGIPMWEWEEEQRRMILRDRYIYMALGRMQPRSPETRAEFDAFVRPSEVREWYDRNPDRFRQRDEAKLAAIHVSDRKFDGDRAKALALAAGIAARARAGEPFEKLTEEVHGDTPFTIFDQAFDRDEGKKYAPEVQEFAWTNTAGAISDPIRTPIGYLVLRLETRQDARVVPFDEVRKGIEDHLYGLKMTIGRLKLQLDLLEDAVVTPRRFKDAIRIGLKAEIAKSLTELHG